MVTYSVSQVESLTGISAHSLRVWERRFDFMQPYRTATNIRYYSDDQLKKLINVGILLRNKYRISKVAAMSESEMHRLVREIIEQPSDDNQEDIKALTISMIDMNEEKFNDLFKSHILRNGLLKTFTSLIYPFLNHVGVLWGTKKAMPAQEHFISNLLRQKLIAATDALPKPKSDSPRLLLFLQEGEDHEIGLLLANYIAKEMGWHTYYLGQNVPLENISAVVQITKPILMFTMMVAPRRAKFFPMLSDLLNEVKIPMLYSGRQDLLNTSVFQKYTKHLGSPEDFIKYLESSKA